MKVGPNERKLDFMLEIVKEISSRRPPSKRIKKK